MLNRVDDAFIALEEAIGLGFRAHNLDHDSDLDNLRGDERFRDLRRRAKLERHS